MDPPTGWVEDWRDNAHLDVRSICRRRTTRSCQIRSECQVFLLWSNGKVTVCAAECLIRRHVLPCSGDEDGKSLLHDWIKDRGDYMDTPYPVDVRLEIERITSRLVGSAPQQTRRCSWGCRRKGSFRCANARPIL